MNDIKMVSLKDVANIKFCIINETQKSIEQTEWITSANLLPENTILMPFAKHNIKADENLSLNIGDIIIKRISPNYVNYIEHELKNIYIYNNLIIVKPKCIDGKYLACVLNSRITEFGNKSSVGAVKPTISRTELENLPIPICLLKEQRLIGELWYKSIAKKKTQLKLLELESKKEMALIDKLIKQKTEESNNG